MTGFWLILQSRSWCYALGKLDYKIKPLVSIVSQLNFKLTITNAYRNEMPTVQKWTLSSPDIRRR